MNMSKSYQPSEFEDRIYKRWEESRAFTPEISPDKVPFTIVIPPPNITGQLHMGHALDETVQDCLIRFKRMQGYAALWLPGTDHASIATEVKIVEQMAEEGLTKKDIGRDAFLERAWAWKDKYGGRIIEQLKKLGCSCDWSRLAFTMDEKCSKAVKEVFVNLYNKGLIYRGNRITNWCPCCKTALSDAEVEHLEDNSFFWHIKYPVKGGGYITVATTRPETMLGDTAVAVNPKDKRYADLIGKSVELPLTGREIPVIADGYVDTEFGSGAVKITPAHDPNDFEVGLRHNLEALKVFNDDGSMNQNAGKYCGLNRFEARKQIIEDLTALGLLQKTEPHTHNVGHCYRCNEVVEPMVSQQWYVKMEPLAKPAIDVVDKKKIKFIPDRFSKIYYNWMENIKDWCISRQLWWGHRIPAYYCDDCGEAIVQKDVPEKCVNCGSTRLRQDEDVLDTWFSSALWPFSTLGYPDKTEDLKYFYPTDVLVTAYDIIFFWVARMIFSGLEHMNRIPFKDVLIHGIVRDAEGRKMSKSLGNGIDPLEVIEKYGADTLRFSLINGISPGGDMRFMVEKVEGCRNFMNKIWNAARFVLMNVEETPPLELSKIKLSPADKWILSKLNRAIREVTLNMEKYELGLACTTLYDFVWSDFCDWYIELTKPALYGDNPAAKTGAVSVLIFVLDAILKLLHPFIPYMTEEIYQNMPEKNGDLIVQDFPRYNIKLNYRKESGDFEAVMQIIKNIRNIKTEAGCPPSKKVKLFVKTDNKTLINKCKNYICKLAGAEELTFIDDKSEPDGRCTSFVTGLAETYIPLGSLVDSQKEKLRLKAELDKVEEEIARAGSKLLNRGFLDKAPKQLIDLERSKYNKYLEIKDKLIKQLEELN